MKEVKKKNLKILLGVTILGVILIGCYEYLLNHPKSQTTIQTDEYTKIIEKDYEKDYPKTPRSVVEEYSNMLTIAYNQKLSGKKLSKLNKKMRTLCSDKLLSQEGNDENSQLINFENDIKKNKSDMDKITSYKLDEISQVEYGNVDGNECAMLGATYSVSFFNDEKKKQGLVKISENYVLEKEKEQWKIIGWKQAE